MGVITKDKKTNDTPEAEEAETQETGPVTFKDEAGNEFRIIEPEDAGPESEGVLPVFLEGQRVQVISGEHAGVSGRMAYITGHHFASDEDYLQFHTAGHPKRMFAEVNTYLVETRDGRNERFSVKPEEIRPLESTNGWGRGSI